MENKVLFFEPSYSNGCMYGVAVIIDKGIQGDSYAFSISHKEGVSFLLEQAPDWVKSEIERIFMPMVQELSYYPTPLQCTEAEAFTHHINSFN